MIVSGFPRAFPFFTNSATLDYFTFLDLSHTLLPDQEGGY